MVQQQSDSQEQQTASFESPLRIISDLWIKFQI